MNITSHGSLSLSDAKFVADESDRRVHEGDVLFNNTNSAKLIGKTAYVGRSGHMLAYSNHMTRLRVTSPLLDPEFLAWSLQWKFERRGFEALASNHVNQASIGTRLLVKQAIALPPLAEQRRIVEILEDHLSRLDAADKALQSASRRGAACLTSSMASLSATEQWPIETIGEHALLVEYGTSSKTSADGPGIPVLRMGNIQRGQLDWSVLKFLPKAHLDFPRLILQPGDLLFNRTNSAELVGKAAVYDDPRPASFASYLIRVRFGPTVDARWANLVINSPRGREYIGSVVSQQVGQANVNGTKLRRFPLPIPPLAEQRARCEAHARLAEDVVRMEASVAAARKRGEALRRGVLSAAFEGKLTGRHTDAEVVEAAAAERDGEAT